MKYEAIYWIAAFIALIVGTTLNTSTTKTDPIFIVWILGVAGVLLTKQYALVARARSKKGIGLQIGCSLMDGLPIDTVPAKDGFPRMSIWVEDGIGAMGIKLQAMVGSGYIIVPDELAFPTNPPKDGQPRGEGGNILFNAWTRRIVDHRQLMPHILERLKNTKSPKYRPDWPVIYGIFPLHEKLPSLQADLEMVNAHQSVELNELRTNFLRMLSERTDIMDTIGLSTRRALEEAKPESSAGVMQKLRQVTERTQPEE